MILEKKVALVTGASRGLGKEVTNLFRKEGAYVIGCSSSGVNNTEECDVASKYKVNKLIKDIQFSQDIDIVVCNAGVYGPIGPLENNNPAEWEETIYTNLFGVVNVCRAVIPQMKENEKGKIIILSGGGATKPMPNFSAYAASKAAVVRFGETLAEELREYNIDVNMVAPGSLNTKFMEQAIEAGPENAGKNFHDQMLKQKDEGGASIENAAELCLFLASEKSDGITGKLIAAVWDDWRKLTPEKMNRQDPDMWTLRRMNGVMK